MSVEIREGISPRDADHDEEGNPARREKQADLLRAGRKSRSGPSIHRPPAIELLSAGEITKAWGVPYTRIYSRLTPLQRRGQRPYYSEVEAREKLGEPLNSITIGSSSPKPTYAGWGEYGTPIIFLVPGRAAKRVTQSLALLNTSRVRKRSRPDTCRTARIAS